MRLFRLGQCIDESDILKNQCGIGVLQLLEDVVLEFADLLIVLFDLGDLVVALSLDARLLEFDDNVEALLFKTLLLNSEVDDSDLGRDLRRVVRVAHTRRDVELELGVVLDLFVSNLDAVAATDTDQGLVENVVEDWVQNIADILEEHLLTETNTILNHFHVSRVLLICDQEVRFTSLDPVHCLRLRIDVKCPSESHVDEAAVLDGETISRKTLDLPLTCLSFRSHECREVVVVRVRQSDLLNHVSPVCHEILTVVRREWTTVTHESSGHQAVSHLVDQLQVQLVNSRLPR